MTRLELDSALLFGIMFALACVWRWQYLQTVVDAPLWPDTETVQMLTIAMTHPYDTSVREPLWLWGTWVFHKMLGEDPLSIRLLSFVASVLLVPAAYVFGRDYGRNRWLGVIAAGLIARHGYLISSSAQGHRTELLILGITAVTYFALVSGLALRRRVIGLAVSSAALMLTSLSTVVVVLPLALWALYKHRMPWPPLLVAGAAVATVVGPHIAYNYATFGTYSHFSSRLVPLFYRNYEFMVVKQTGCDGCPTLEAFRRDSYSGEPISMRDYLFKLHTAAEVATRTLSGIASAFLWRGQELEALIGGGSTVQYLTYWSGLLIAAATFRRELLLVMLLTLNLTAFLVPLGIDPRLLTGPAVVAAVLQGLAPILLASWLVRRAMPDRANRP